MADGISVVRPCDSTCRSMEFIGVLFISVDIDIVFHRGPIRYRYRMYGVADVLRYRSTSPANMSMSI